MAIESVRNENHEMTRKQFRGVITIECSCGDSIFASPRVSGGQEALAHGGASGTRRFWRPAAWAPTAGNPAPL